MEKIIVITERDFEKFKEELLNEVRALLDNNIHMKKWIRSKDVREILGISDSTLQTLRINRTIPAYKLDSTWFYKYDEITEVMENSRVN